MNRLTNAIATSLTSQQANIPRRNVVEVVRDYNEVSNLMQHATTQNREFYENALSILNQEMMDIANESTTTNRNPTNNT